MSNISTLEDLYIEQLKDLYNAEIQLIEALPEMVQTAHAVELKDSFLFHLEQTYRHVERLEEILENLGERPTGHKCDAMIGLIKESKKTLEEEAPHEVKDAALIAAAQRIEHYEIAGYGCVRTYAKLLGDEHATDLLQITLNEETETDRLLTKVSEKLNVQDDALSYH